MNGAIKGEAWGITRKGYRLSADAQYIEAMKT